MKHIRIKPVVRLFSLLIHVFIDEDIVCTEVKKMEITLYIVCGIAFLLSIIFSARSGKMFRNLAISSALGFGALLLFVVFGKSIGIEVNLNIVTALLSVTGGVPGAVFAALMGMFI